MTSHYTWGSVTILHEFGGVLGRPLDTFLLGSHNFMVTALGSCVRWPWSLLEVQFGIWHLWAGAFIPTWHGLSLADLTQPAGKSEMKWHSMYLSLAAHVARSTSGPWVYHRDCNKSLDKLSVLSLLINKSRFDWVSGRSCNYNARYAGAIRFSYFCSPNLFNRIYVLKLRFTNKSTKRFLERPIESRTYPYLVTVLTNACVLIFKMNT